jgi:hypothetical protein
MIIAPIIEANECLVAIGTKKDFAGTAFFNPMRGVISAHTRRTQHVITDARRLRRWTH